MKIQTKSGAVIAAGTLKQNSPVEYRKVGSNDTPLATFGVMVARGNPQEGSQPEWLNCKAWRNLANKIAVCPGGAEVLIAGHMEEENWRGRDGEKHSRQVCVCEFVAMATFAAAGSSSTAKIAEQPKNVTFEEIGEDTGELPF